MTLGEKIKFYRKKASKSQKDIQKETGIPQTTLSGWENDISEPTISDAKKLIVALNISITDLLDYCQCQHDMRQTG